MGQGCLLKTPMQHQGRPPISHGATGMARVLLMLGVLEWGTIRSPVALRLSPIPICTSLTSLALLLVIIPPFLLPRVPGPPRRLDGAINTSRTCSLINGRCSSERQVSRVSRMRGRVMATLMINAFSQGTSSGGWPMSQAPPLLGPTIAVCVRSAWEP